MGLLRNLLSKWFQGDPNLPQRKSIGSRLRWFLRRQILLASLLCFVLLILHFYKCFLVNTNYLENFSIRQTALPSSVSLQDRKYHVSNDFVYDLQKVSNGSLAQTGEPVNTSEPESAGLDVSNKQNFEVLNQYLSKHQVSVYSHTFKVEKAIISPDAASNEPGKDNFVLGTNHYAILEGRKNHNLECMVLAFNPGRLPTDARERI